MERTVLRFLGYLLIIVGAGAGGYVGLVGLSFSAVYLMGFIGTAGREAGGELATMLILTFGVIIVSWLMVKLGMKLKSFSSGKPECAADASETGTE